MRNRLLLGALLLCGLALPITSCNTSPDLTSIVVSPSAMNFGGAGLTTQLTAMGYYTHPGHPPVTKDITDQVTWSSSTPDCVTVSSTGLITSGGNVCSNILVTASSPGFNGLITGTMTVNVTQPSSGGGGGTTNGDVTSISLIPSSQTVLATGQTAQYIAIGTTGTGATVDLTGTATWSSSNVAVGTINATGLATAMGAGTTAISAIAKNPDGTIVMGTASFTVQVTTSAEPLVSLAIVPASQTAFAIGQTAQYLAIATTGSGTTEDVTGQAAWGSSNVSVGTINPTTGLATAVGAGTTAITAIVKNPDGTVVTGTASFTVTPTTVNEPYSSLTILPSSQTASSVNETSQFLAIATTGAGTTVDVTSQAVWSSSDVSVATIGASTGLATALSSGTTAIVAVFSNPDGTVVTATATYTVNVSSTEEPLLSLTIIPTSQTVNSPNETSQYLAIGTFSASGSQSTSICGSTGTTQDCTNYVKWVSSDPSVGTVNQTGLATGLNVGTTAITAIATNPDGSLVTGAASFTETDADSAAPQQATLTITLLGSGAANGQITAPAPGTTSPNVIDCTATNPSGCVQTFQIGSVVTLTATPLNGAQFGGGSTNCTPINATQCQITLNGNETVGAIFY